MRRWLEYYVNNETMDIVQFKNGKYGIRKRNWFQRVFNKGGSFYDFRPALFKWRKQYDNFFHDCQLESVDEVKECLLKLKSNYVIKVIR